MEKTELTKVNFAVGLTMKTGDFCEWYYFETTHMLQWQDDIAFGLCVRDTTATGYVDPEAIGFVRHFLNIFPLKTFIALVCFWFIDASATEAILIRY